MFVRFYGVSLRFLHGSEKNISTRMGKKLKRKILNEKLMGQSGEACHGRRKKLEIVFIKNKIHVIALHSHSRQKSQEKSFLLEIICSLLSGLFSRVGPMASDVTGHCIDRQF